MIRTADDGNGRFARRITLSILLLWLLSAQLSVQASWGQGKAAVPLYLDRTRPIEARVDDLLKRMTLKEKVGQLQSTLRLRRCAWKDDRGEDGFGAQVRGGDTDR